MDFYYGIRNDGGNPFVSRDDGSNFLNLHLRKSSIMMLIVIITV
jgi:hypothetical protein